MSHRGSHSWALFSPGACESQFRAAHYAMGARAYARAAKAALLFLHAHSLLARLFRIAQRELTRRLFRALSHEIVCEMSSSTQDDRDNGRGRGGRNLSA